MRWVSLIGAVVGFAIFFGSKTPGMMGLGVFIGFACLFVSLFAFAAARIAANSRPDTMMLTDKDIGALQASMRKAREGTGGASAKS